MYKFIAEYIRDVCDIISTNIPITPYEITENDMQKMAEKIVIDYLQYNMQNYLKYPAIKIAKLPTDYAKCYNGMKVKIWVESEEYDTAVIGKTCVIGENCTILNGVILGGKVINSEDTTGKRSPAI